MNRSHSVLEPRQRKAAATTIFFHRDRELRHRNNSQRSAIATASSGPATTKAAPATFTINTDPLPAREPDSNHHQRSADLADLKLRPTRPLQQREQDAFFAMLQH
ncbi:hypothetical protein DEO72_LG2g743 [Vigna unguiculata]|uniref:Uncharacterized protein n=1 Tax=Vigna unguiculata TaxID=3917 RepID=A0A4D6KZL6_VIGUN|nr:hypothetical protein DEO72_LG2g742 [Vigna unguiculata]QCD80422.1 hypothetical protein DEO72_LG2g743 [Vigna unguiculata]